MFVRSFQAVALFVGMLASMPTPVMASDAATSPTLIIRARSIDGLLADVKHLASLIGHEKEGKLFDTLFNAVFPKGLAGIDTKRPVAVYGQVDADGTLRDLGIALLLPISDEKAFLGLLDDRKIKARKDSDDIYAVDPEFAKVPVYFRFANKYVYITIRDKDAVMTERLVRPEKVLSGSQGETIAANFRIDQIPFAIRQVILSAVETKLLDIEEEKKPGETPAQHLFHVQAARESARQFSATVKNGTDLAVRLNLDPKAHEIALEASLAGKPGTPLAASIAAFGKQESLFGVLHSADSAISASVCLALPENIRKALAPAVDDTIRSALQNEKNADQRARLEKVFKAVAPTVKSGELDAAFDLRVASAGKPGTLVVGIKIKDGAGIEAALRELLKDQPENVRNLIKLDAETAGSAKIHRVDMQQNFDADATRLFGKNPFFVAIQANALVIGGGEAALQAVKNTLGRKPAAVPPIRFEAAFARLAPLMSKSKKGDPAVAAQKAFAGTEKDNEKVQFRIEGGETLKIRLQIKEPVIKFFHHLDEMSKGK